MAIRPAAIFIVLVLLNTACSKILFRSAEKAFNKDLVHRPYDVIIVPGFPYDGENWDRTLKMRINWAKYLYVNGYTKNIIFSGSAVATKYIESRVMANYAEAIGIPRKNLFTEEKAEHSTENVYYSYRLAKELGFTKIALATDPYQNSYMRKFINNFELPIYLLPAVVDTLRILDMPEPKIEVNNTIQANFVKLSDRENFFQRFKGTIGRYITWHEEDLKKKKYRRRYKQRMIPASVITKEP